MFCQNFSSVLAVYKFDVAFKPCKLGFKLRNGSREPYNVLGILRAARRGVGVCHCRDFGAVTVCCRAFGAGAVCCGAARHVMPKIRCAAIKLKIIISAGYAELFPYLLLLPLYFII